MLKCKKRDSPQQPQYRPYAVADAERRCDQLPSAALGDDQLTLSGMQLTTPIERALIQRRLTSPFDGGAV
jgi:hypothetical protein